MGDYWNDSGWYEQQRDSYFKEKAEREQEAVRYQEMQAEQRAWDASRANPERENNRIVGDWPTTREGRPSDGLSRGSSGNPSAGETGSFWIAPIVEVLIVGLGVYFHLLVETLLLVNLTIGAFSLVILSLLAFGGKAKKLVWLAWIPTIGIGYLVYKGSLPNGDFMLWLAIMGAAFTIYSVYRLVSKPGRPKKR